jgi:hypothetical protein
MRYLNYPDITVDDTEVANLLVQTRVSRTTPTT